MSVSTSTPAARYPARLVVGLLAVSLATLGQAAPVGANHEEEPRNGLEEAGFHPLGNTGFHTDIMPWVSQDGRVFAATGTWGTLLQPLQDCPSETDNPVSPSDSGVKIIEATDPANPQLGAHLGTIPGAQNNDVKVDRLPTVDGERDLLVHSLEPCGIEGLLHQIPGSPFIDIATAVQQATGLDQTGFQVYDVDDPANPVRLGAFNNGGIGTHNLYVFSQGERSFVAAVFNKVDILEVADDFVVGILQIVEITDPNNPTLVSEWRLSDAAAQSGPTAEQLCQERGRDSALCVLHDVWVSDDGATAYLSFWDAGLILLDVADPANPTFIGQAQEQVQLPDDPEGWLNEEGNTHAAVPTTVDGRDLVIVGDEDFTGGGEIGVTVNAPAELAGFTPATQWSGTAPVAGQRADFVYAGTGCTPAQYAGVDADGKIALVDKFTNKDGVTDCPTFIFKQKMDAAEAAGAIGLVQIDNNDEPSGGNAISSGIPGFEISNSAGVPISDEVTDGDEVAVNATLERGGNIDPWGFMRVVDVTDPDPANWREVAQFKAPHVEDPEPDSESTFTAHNPIVGPDGRIYFSWYTNGARVLELGDGGATVNEIAWFAPRPEDHLDDNDSDPRGIREDNAGFWGSWPLCHPDTGELLVFNSDSNRGIYVLRALYDDCLEDVADLAISEEDIEVTSLRGRQLQITATVHNLGSAPASSVAVLFEGDGEQIGEIQTIAEIQPGGTGQASVVWRVTERPRSHTVTVTVDPSDAIAESDEGNNSASTVIELSRGQGR